MIIDRHQKISHLLTIVARCMACAYGSGVRIAGGIARFDPLDNTG